MNAVDFILSQPWALPADRVESMLATASRMNLDIDAVAAKLGKPLENARNVQVRQGVAVIPVRGVISRYANLFHAVCGGTSVEILARDVRAALDNKDVHAIILEIDSPGGQVAGIGELAAMIHAGSQIKPIVSYVSNLGASAGYWLASAGSEVAVAPSAMLGSVGVVLPMSRTTDDGRSIEFVSSQSPHKRLSTETADGRARIQANVDALASVFIAAVAEYRDTTPEKVVSGFGGGDILVGQAAVDAGMADRISDLESLISELSDGGPAGSSHPIMHGGAADAASEDSPTMKFTLKSILAAIGKNPSADVIELNEADAAAAGPEAISNNAGLVRQALALPTARERELEAQLEAALKAANEAQASKAEAWFAALVKEGRAVPAEKDGVLKVYAALASDPALLGSYTAGFESRPKNGLTTESVPTDAERAKAILDKGGFKLLPHAATSPSEAEAREDAETLALMLEAAQDD